MDENLPIVSGWTSPSKTQSSRQIDEKYSNILSLRKRRQGTESSTQKAVEITIFDSDSGNEEILACLDTGSKQITESSGKSLKEKGNFFNFEEELSPLKHFTPIPGLLQRGGDVAQRVRFVLEMFGINDELEDVQVSTAPKKSRRSPISVPGLDPGKASTAQTSVKRRLGHGRFPKRK
jgi:hypothetical protein